MSGTPFDEGLQPERTLLAWRRTSLSLAVCCLLMIRFWTERLGVTALAAGLLGLVLTTVAYIDSARRYRLVHAHLTSGRELPSPAIPVTLLATAVALFALTCMAWVMTVSAL